MNDIASLFHRISMGVYVIAVRDGELQDAFTAASVVQASYDPPLLILAVNAEHASYELLRKSEAWTVSVLSSDQIKWATHFGTRSGRDTDKMKGASWAAANSGLPYLRDALAYFDCKLIAEYPGGDHRLVLGRATDGTILRPNDTPLLYADTHEIDHSASMFPPRL